MRFENAEEAAELIAEEMCDGYGCSVTDDYRNSAREIVTAVITLALREEGMYAKGYLDAREDLAQWFEAQYARKEAERTEFCPPSYDSAIAMRIRAADLSEES